MEKTDIRKLLKAMLLAVLVIAVFGCGKVYVNAAGAIADVNGNAATALTTETVTTGTEDNANKYIAYKLSVDGATKTAVFPIIINKAGMLDYNWTTYGAINGTAGSAKITFYADAACRNRVSRSGSNYVVDFADSANAANKDGVASVHNWVFFDVPGTYYAEVKVSSDTATPASSFSFGFSSHLFQSEDRSLSDKKWTTAKTYNQQEVIYFKVKIDETGYIAVEQDYVGINNIGNYTGGYDGASYITLCNSKKKAISGQCYNNADSNDTQVFAVKEGTYYLKVKSSNLYRIRYKFTAQSEEGRTTKAKAKTIKIGKSAVKGLVYATDRTSTKDWYKFVLPKNQTVSIFFEGNACNATGGLKMTIIPPKNVTLYGGTDTEYGTDFDGGIKSNGKWAKGTYYITVSKTNSGISGNYSLRITK